MSSIVFIDGAVNKVYISIQPAHLFVLKLYTEYTMDESKTYTLINSLSFYPPFCLDII